MAVPFHKVNHKISINHQITQTTYSKHDQYTQTDTIRQKNTITLFKDYYFALQIQILL